MASTSDNSSKRSHDENVLVVPKNLKIENDSAVSLNFHPTDEVLGVGTMSGGVQFFSVNDTGSVRHLMTLELHKNPVRCLQFSEDGQLFATASKDKGFTVNDFSTGKLISRTSKAHESPIFSLHVLSEFCLATGDEDGAVKVWDKRHPGGPVCEFEENEDLVTDFLSDERNRMLINSSADGTITALDLRKKAKVLQSENFEAELLSMAAMKSGSKVICGAGDGSMQIFNWGEWGNISDRMPSYTDSSIDVLVPINDQVVLSGSFDGKIRALSIYPNKVLETVGTHGEFPIEALSRSHNKKLLASCSHDELVKFYNIEKFDDMFIEMPTKKSKKAAKSKAKEGGFFGDL